MKELRTLDDLEFDPENSNEGTDRGRAAVAESIADVGLVRGIAVSREGRIVAGNKTARAAREAGLKKIQVVDVEGDTLVVVRRTDLQAEDARTKRAGVLDNRASELGLKWNAEEVLKRAREIPFSKTLFTERELRRLKPAPREQADENAGLEVDAPLRSRSGDRWTLGDHRLVVGDSFKDEVALLLEGAKVAAVVTDPPYAIYGSSSGVSTDIADEKMVRPFFEQLGALLAREVRRFGHSYVFCDWRSYPVLVEAFKVARLTAKNCIVWDKGGSGLGSNYANTHEFIAFYSNLPPMKAMRSSAQTGQRLVHEPNIYRANRPTGLEREHNAAKPVDLIAWFLENSTDRGDVVADFFTGSGSTMMACERLGRRFRGMEVDPKNADIAIARWERVTGRTASVERTE